MEPDASPFGHLVAAWVERFPETRRRLEEDGVDVRNRDAFVLARPGAELLHEIRPEEPLGDAIREYVALVHATFLWWLDGERTVRLDREALARLVGADPAPESDRIELEPAACYVQLPPLRVWGAPIPDQATEPLDGFFLIPDGKSLRAVALFGLHSVRAGCSVVEVEGPRPGAPRRDDGSPPFSAVLPGGSEAGLLSITGMAELLELIWRARGVIPGIRS